MGGREGNRKRKTNTVGLGKRFQNPLPASSFMYLKARLSARLSEE